MKQEKKKEKSKSEKKREEELKKQNNWRNRIKTGQMKGNQIKQK